MTNEWDSKDCFGRQGEDIIYGDPPYDCLECLYFDKCHKISVASCLQAISSDLDLIVQNGLVTNKLLGFAELSKLADIDMRKKH